MPYLSALEVRSRRGAIQIHVYHYLYLSVSFYVYVCVFNVSWRVKALQWLVTRLQGHVGLHIAKLVWRRAVLMYYSVYGEVFRRVSVAVGQRAAHGRRPHQPRECQVSTPSRRRPLVGRTSPWVAMDTVQQPRRPADAWVANTDTCWRQTTRVVTRRQAASMENTPFNGCHRRRQLSGAVTLFQTRLTVRTAMCHVHHLHRFRSKSNWPATRYLNDSIYETLSEYCLNDQFSTVTAWCSLS